MNIGDRVKCISTTPWVKSGQEGTVDYISIDCSPEREHLLGSIRVLWDDINEHLWIPRRCIILSEVEDFELEFSI